MPYGKGIMYSLWMLQQALLNKVADVKPHCANVVHFVPPSVKNFILSNYISMPLPFLSNLRLSFPWLLTGHLKLDISHTSFSQDLYMSYGPPLVGRRHREAQSGVRQLF